jgi:tellurite resistance protein TerC
MTQQTWLWVIFSGVALAMMALDLGLLHRKAHAVRPREAAIWSGIWVAVAMVVGVAILLMEGRQKGLEFLTGYLIELSLSVDNIFVFVLIFAYFKVPPLYQHRVLFWGIVGAVVLRGAFIFGGIALLNLFHWLIYLLGVVLIWGGIQLFRQDKVGVHPERNRLLQLFQRFVPMLREYDGQKFLVRREGRLLATPLMAVLLVIETTDLIFALDSIPAILAITRDSFIVFSSNICAILGLRSLYFLFAALVDRLRFLHYGLAVVLCFVGLKMVSSEFVELPIGISLGFVAVTLAVSVICSLAIPPKRVESPAGPPSTSAQ